MAYSNGNHRSIDIAQEQRESIVLPGEETDREHVPTIVIRERTLKKAIIGLVGRLGLGLCDPVPYETAWVARIPLKDDLTRPAFPLSLQWLRNNQQDDGSWGVAPPFSPHSSTLNTLATIITLSQWNDPQDKIRIQRGVKALWDLAPQLPGETHEGVGFELIIPVLQNEARKFGLDVPHEFYRIYKEKSGRKLNLVYSEFKRHGYSKPATWWHSLEILGDESEIKVDNCEIQYSASMLLANGSVGASPSATAYLLRAERLKGRDTPEAEDYLMEMYTLYQGGISQVYPIDIFELAFGIDFFLKAGFSAKDPLFAESIGRLSQRCTPRDAIGFSSHFKMPDADDMSVALYVLHQAGYDVSLETLLTKFFRKTHFACFMHEMNFSLSTNVNALRTLRLYQNHPDVNQVVETISNFLQKDAVLDASHKKQILVYDKWHKSQYYSSSRAVFSLYGLRNNVVDQLVAFFVENQNEDGGWGENSYSTAEETAYVTLALCFARRHGYNFSDDVLMSASEFLFGMDSRSNAELWIGKVVYRPTLVAESAILAAQHAVTRIFDLTTVRTVLRESNPFYVSVTYHEGDRCAFTGNLLSFTSGFDIKPYSSQIAGVRKDIVDRLIELGLMKEGYARKVSLDIFICCIREEVSDEHLKFYSLLGMAIFLWDDILDGDWVKYAGDVSVVEQVFGIFWSILSGELGNIDDVLPLDFPNFIPFCKLFVDMRQGLTSQPNDAGEFLAELKMYLNNDIANLRRGLPRSSEEYLEMKHRCMAMDLFCSVSNMFKDLNVRSFENCQYFLDIKYYGSRAARLVGDIFAFGRDEEEPHETNYVLLKRDELEGSTVEALDSSVKLYNQFVLRMLTAKKMIQSDSKYKDNTDLFRAILKVECFVDGLRDWASRTARYKAASRNANVRLSDVIKQLSEVDLRLFIDDKKPASLV